MAEHSPIGASSASRWMTCPGSVKLSRSAPTSTSNKYAAQGTAAHEVLEKCFPHGDPFDYVGRVMSNGWTFESEDAEAVLSAMDAIKEHVDGSILHIPFPERDWSYKLEERVDLREIHKDLFGTADIVLESKDGKKIKIIDYKHGTQSVEVENNTQLKYYALGAIMGRCRDKYDPCTFEDVLDEYEEVEIAIAQPRCDHHDGPFRTWIFSREAMKDFMLELGVAVLATEDDNAPLEDGSHCRWCPALALCPRISGQAMEVAQQDFRAISDPVNLHLPDAGTMSPGMVAKILRFEPLFTDWLKAVEAYGSFLAHEGEEIPGHKLVKRKANRQWKDQEQVTGILGTMFSEDELYIKKLKSPAQVEKLMGKNKKAIADYVFAPDNGLTLVADSDRRKAVTVDNTDKFDVITD